MTSLRLALALSFIVGTTVALAAEHTISQKGKVFSETMMSLKRGDTLVFLNDDNVVHNVMSITPGNEFNLGTFRPGNSKPFTFDKTGEMQIICAIHPAMQMMVKVTD